MIEIKLDVPFVNNNEQKRQLFVIKNEKGLYLKNSHPYWTTDLNKCVSNLRNLQTQINNARSMIKTQEEYKSGKSKCLNPDFYFGFEKLFIQEVSVIETN